MNNYKIMIVDDSGIAREMLKDALCHCGANVVAEAGGGHQALQILDHVSPDIVTLDYNMPDIDGEETLRLILEKKPDAKVVIVSSLTEPMMAEDLKKIGAKAVFAKPFKPDKLIDVLDKIVKGEVIP